MNPRTDQESYPQPRSVEVARNHANKLINPMCDNTTPITELPASINEFNHYYQYILSSHRETLTKIRDELIVEKTGGITYINQQLDADSPIVSLNDCIKTTNILLDASQESLLLIPALNTKSLDPNLQEIKDIQFYIACRQRIDDYVLRLHIFLSAIREKISTTHWKEKSIFGIWIGTTPEPIDQMKKSLDKLTNKSTLEEILKTYTTFLKLLTAVSILENPHESVDNFYRNTCNDMKKSLTFLTANSNEQKREAETTDLTGKEENPPVSIIITESSSAIADKSNVTKKSSDSSTHSSSSTHKKSNDNVRVSKMSLLSPPKQTSASTSNTKQQTTPESDKQKIIQLF